MSETEAYTRSAQRLAANLRMVRAFRGLTRAEVAGTALITVESLGQYERGGGNPRLRTIARLARALNTSPLFLLSEVKIPDTDDEATP